MGFQADQISANRKILEEIEYRVRCLELEGKREPADLIKNE
jgi:hypothetical protein